MIGKVTLLGAIGLAFAACSFSGASDEISESKRKPNVVLIMADDLGHEGLSCYGSADYKTPNLDELAANGIRFTHCYSQPLCTPSRVQIMTGRYNHRNYEGFGFLNPKEKTFGNLLTETGYATCIAGKWQLSGDASTIKSFGFDEHCVWNMIDYKSKSLKPCVVPFPECHLKRYDAPVMFVNGKWQAGSEDEYGPQVAADFVCSFIERNKKRPFLCYYPMILVHSPFVPTPDSPNGMKGDRKSNFRDMVAYMDKLVGQIVDQLERSGVLDNTIILFTGDNGTHKTIASKMTDGRSIKGGKADMTDAGTHVPFVAYWKGVTPEGVVCDDLIDFSDFLPTLAEAAGVPLPTDRTIDGVSFCSQLKGKEGSPREWVFCHYWDYGRNKKGAREFVRDRRWKLYDNGTLIDAQNVKKRKSMKEPSAAAEAAKRRLESAFETVHGSEKGDRHRRQTPQPLQNQALDGASPPFRTSFFSV